jgi:glycosyltransferase involved in cell wall biosynthesis
MSDPTVLFVDHAGVLGGAELYLLDVARQFEGTSHVVLFEPGPFEDRLRAHDVSVEVCPAPAAFLNVQKSSGWASAASFLPGLVRLSVQLARRARDYDLLYANSQKAFFVAGLAGVLARRPVVWNLHDLLTADHFSGLTRRTATFWANAFADHVIVNSRATHSAFVESGGRAEKTTVVYNGIDATPFAPSVLPPPQQTRDAFDLPAGPLVGIFSRLAPWKGQHVLLEALSQLPDVHGLLVGDALFRGDESYKTTLHRRAERLGVADRIHFLGFRDNIAELMHAVDAVVHASTEPEPFGRVIVEGMLARRPVIATRAGGAAEIIQHRQTGLLTSPGNADELSEAVDWLVSNPERASQLAEAGRQHALDRFSLDTMMTQISDVIYEVTSSRA